MNVLFASSEVWPLIKTGGLGDVAYSLPHALNALGNDVRLVIPAYQAVIQQLDSIKVLGWLPPFNADHTHPLRILEARHPQFAFPLWLVDSQALFDRPGNPYSHADGGDWPDNAERFATFAYAVAQLGQGSLLKDNLNTDWQADVVHCNDWQTGLVPAFLSEYPQRPKCIFTIHNLAYGGHFSKEVFSQLRLPWHWWTGEGVEFYGGFSMLKAGLTYADAITTVSPTYAKEICTPAFGYGMEGVLMARQHKLTGILNGIDTSVWNPTTDTLIEANYSAEQINPGKQKNKAALLKAFGQKPTKAMLAAPLLGMVGRLVEQKGIDLVLNILPRLLDRTNANLVVIGSGDDYYASQLETLATRFPRRVMTYIGYSEQRAHLLEAGADLFLMPSRFEPCGLNQLYSMRYGTPPIVHKTGGLADTVCHASPVNMKNGKATGFVLNQPTSSALFNAIQWALKLYAQAPLWQQLQQQAMQQNFDWQSSAEHYLDLYR